MVEYGQSVGQAGQIAGGGTGHAVTSGPTDVGAQAVADLTGMLNQASATIGVPPGLLALVALVAVLFVGWLVFVR